jgi:5-formyltetrahydrofolate cyclo-ligase
VDPNVPTKDEVRASVVAARRALPAEVRSAEASALREYLIAATSPGATVCAYVPVGTEPGSPELLDALVGTGVRVLLPVAREVDGEPQPLSWGEYASREALVPAPFGLREPAEPWLPPEAIGVADVVVVPALAVDRRGARLGRGAGYYDRTLGLAGSAALLVAVVRDAEIVDRLPAEPHDVAMTHALTPGRGLVALGS